MKKRILASVLTLSMAASVLAGFVGAPVAQASSTAYVQPNKTYQVGDTVYFGNYWQNDTNGSGKADQNDAKEPIEWRVLSQNGDDLFLMSTKGLDAQQYNSIFADVTWESCTLRTWMNDVFYNDAFSASEQNAIKTTTLENADNTEYGTDGGNSTNDKVFLLSLSDVTNTSYGFSSSYNSCDTNRQIKATEYAIDSHAWVETSGGCAGNCCWWLRSPGDSSNHATIVIADGYVNNCGNSVDYTLDAVCPALHLNLKSINPTPEASNPASPTATPTPTVLPTTEYVQSGKTYQVGDTVYFGNYWQNDTNGSGIADQNDAKEPIEWRVLSQNGDDLFLMATKGLDAQPYNEKYINVTWETSTLRTWMNDDFYNDAFSASEQNAIKTTTLENEDNTTYGTEGGNNTKDNVFLLSLSDVTNTSYGFSSSSSTCDTKRQIKATEYAVDNGAYVSTSDGYAGNCWWWVRLPGNYSIYATVLDDGYVYGNGYCVDDATGAVCPALHLNLKSINQTPEASNPVSPTATPTPTVLPTTEYVQLGKTYQVGDTVYFGNYWQNDTNGSGKADQNDAKEPIEWRVLSQNGDDLFLMATKGLDAQPYNETYTNVTWETCTLRTWLNDDFYNDAFSASEQNAIKTTTLENEDNFYCGTEGGASTNDKVFLLSLSDITNTSYGFSSNYSTYDTNKQVKATEYAIDSGAYVETSGGFAGNCWWWLRSPGDYSTYASYVHIGGGVGYFGDLVYSTLYAVCPALHLNLKSINPTPQASNLASPTATPTPETPVTPSATVQPTKIPTASPTATLSPSPSPITGDYQYKIKNDGTVEITKYTGTASVLEIPSLIDGYTVTSIGESAFANNNLLNIVIMPAKLVTIGNYAFESCKNISTVTFNDSVETIGSCAFNNCITLKSVSLPQSIKSIGTNAFGYDASFNKIAGFSIIGYAGVAQEYAKMNGMSFTNLVDNTVTKKSVKFTKKKVTIKKGKKVTLKVKITGAKKATFSVDKKGKKVVKLFKKKAKSVTVKGKKKGKATITAKITGKKAMCKVTVK